LRRQVVNRAVGAAVAEALRRAGKLAEASQDDLCTGKAALEAAQGLLSAQEYKDTAAAADAAKRAAEARTAWRIDGTLREFPKFPPIDLWFDYPIHRGDESGVLGDIHPEETAPTWKKAAPKSEKKDRRKMRLDALETAFEACDVSGKGRVSIADLMEYSGKTKNTIRSWVDEHPNFERHEDGVKRVKNPVLKN